MVKVHITYRDGAIAEISVDGQKMKDIEEVQSLPVSRWFAFNQNGEWMGLAKEVRRFYNDENAPLQFDFTGPKDVAKAFAEEARKNGYELKKSSAEEQIAEYKEKAKRAEAHGNRKDARDAYKAAADLGDAEAQYKFAHYAEQGTGGEADDGLAAIYYEQAARQGHVQAQYEMGSRYSAGRGVAVDKEKAAEWYQKAAEQGHAAAQFELGES
jgi:TPR repeat protein